MTNIEIVQKQEDMLWFDHFDNDDSWKLGKFMVEKSQKDGVPFAISIRLHNGYQLFTYAPNGTSIFHQLWMDRKANVVKMMDRSSILSMYILNGKNQPLEYHGLSSMECTLAGGGFPIRVKGVGHIGVVLASALSDEEDHEFIVESIQEFLGVKDVPHLEV